MDEAEEDRARAWLALQNQVITLQRHVESLTASVEALIRLLPPARRLEYEALYAEIYAAGAAAGSMAETLSKMRQRPEDEPGPPRTDE